MGLYGRIIRYLYNMLPEEKEKILRSDLLKDYYNTKYPTAVVNYNGRVLPGSNTRFKVDVRDFFTLNDESINTIAKSLITSTMTDNQKALACVKYVIQNFPYKSDNTNYSAGEFWCMPFESLRKGSGDCEDGAILMANLMIAAGIPNWKVRIVAGYVLEPHNKTLVGHGYVTFFDEENEKWVILDWCYYPNIKPIANREEYKKETMYQDVWFSFNNEHAWAKNDGDVRNMEGF